MTQAAPTFFLYGEPPQAAGDSFLHVEPLDVRSRPANWTIRAHRHHDLNHVFLLSAGAGELDADGSRLGFAAPCLLLIPAGVTHALSYVLETAGQVLTVSSAMLADCSALAPEFDALFADAGVLPLAGEFEEARSILDRLMRELAWRAPAHGAAVRASLVQVLVMALRLKVRGEADPTHGEGRDHHLVARLREQIEHRFRRPEPITAYAAALGVSLSRLRAACRATGVAAPLDLVQDRRVLEAKRALLYSHLNVGEIAASLGFEDAAYFNRLFRRKVGLPPRRFRERSRTEAAP